MGSTCSVVKKSFGNSTRDNENNLTPLARVSGDVASTNGLNASRNSTTSSVLFWMSGRKERKIYSRK